MSRGSVALTFYIPEVSRVAVPVSTYEMTKGPFDHYHVRWYFQLPVAVLESPLPYSGD